jgi:hypothetical protein
MWSRGPRQVPPHLAESIVRLAPRASAWLRHSVPVRAKAGPGGEAPLAPDRRRPHTARRRRAEIGTSFWTALERPDVDEIVGRLLRRIYPPAELRGDPAAKAIRRR